MTQTSKPEHKVCQLCWGELCYRGETVKLDSKFAAGEICELCEEPAEEGEDAFIWVVSPNWKDFID